MPGYDGSGPEGNGPVGRGLGPCGEGRKSPRRAFLGGWGGRRRMRRPFRKPGYFAGDEKTSLNTEKNWLTQQLQAIDKRLADIPED